MEIGENHMTQQVYLGNGDLCMNEYTFELLNWLKIRVYLYMVKIPHFIRVYNLKKELRFVHIFTLYGKRSWMQGPQIRQNGAGFLSPETLHLQK